MRKYLREEEVKELTPEEAEEVLAANDGKTIGDEAEDILQDTDSLPSYLQYNDAEDPEMMEESYKQFNRESRSVRLHEAASWIGKQIQDYFDENGGDTSDEAFEDFKDNVYFTPEGKRALSDKILHERWVAEAARLMRNSGSTEKPEPELAYDPENPYEGMSDDAIQFAQLLNDFQDTELSAEETAEAKYDQLANVTANIVMGESFKKHAFICGDAGVGKTYAINKISKELWPKSPLKSNGWTLNYNKGDIGQSIMPITSFFFEHRDKEIIILDDADAFLKKNDDRVLNMLKGMLNTENTIDHPEPVYIPASIRLSAAQFLKKPDISCTKTEQEVNWQQGMYFKENTMKINAQKFQEGIMELSMNGNIIYSGRLTEAEKEHYGIITNDELARKREAKKLLGLGVASRFTENEDNVIETVEDEPAEDIGDVENGDPEFGGGKNDKGKFFLPEQFIFTSRLIMISNLAPSQVNEAFKSRCDVVAITLTHDEFVAHLAKVVPGLMHDMETTIPDDLVDLIKNENYGYLKRLMELEGRPLAGRTVQINIPLQFRLIPEMCGKWLACAKAYCRRHEVELTAENFRVIATAIEPIFVVNTLIPFLADTQYSGDPNRRKH